MGDNAENFNQNGRLTSLPAGSFNFPNLTTVGRLFMDQFNANGGSLTSLPDGAFDMPNLTTVGPNFFTYFNYDNGKLTKATT
ncbi:MAG: hypothetical protein LBO09_00145 [Candidatus Peribacteria bacterium]|nr:hypothetical protein [Candidatus Peribacteria bacterium]